MYHFCYKKTSGENKSRNKNKLIIVYQEAKYNSRIQRKQTLTGSYNSPKTD